MKRTDPDLDNISVPLRLGLCGSPLQQWRQEAQGTIIDALEQRPGVEDHHMILPG